DHADAYWITPDGRIETNFWTHTEGWHQPFSIAPPGSAAPGAIATLSRAVDHADAYWTTPDGRIETNFWTHAEGWHQPFTIAPPGSVAKRS
ncbi:hypothetical protein, partial [Actinomadura kijaniata]|uniref:hypothetical protein n=1 Tax=Actinomadura kijaniata TaxID=46161 RepID=UPI000A522319